MNCAHWAFLERYEPLLSVCRDTHGHAKLFVGRPPSRLSPLRHQATRKSSRRNGAEWFANIEVTRRTTCGHHDLHDDVMKGKIHIIDLFSPRVPLPTEKLALQELLAPRVAMEIDLHGFDLTAPGVVQATEGIGGELTPRCRPAAGMRRIEQPLSTATARLGSGVPVTGPSRP